ncbi:MAG: hypothetical protein GY817_08800 [bacterium]|nr:hypothetical protein [bacterium]
MICNKPKYYFSFLMKKISLILCFSLLILNMNNFVYAKEASSAIKETSLILPDTMGKIVAVFQGQTNKKVYLINDLHCHYQVQANIADFLDFLDDTHPQGLLIGVEGNSGLIDNNRFKFMPDGRLKNKVMDTLLKKGLITGWEKYADKNKSAFIYGIEDSPLYQNNFNQLYQNLTYYDFIADLKNKVTDIMNSGSRLLFSQPIKDLEQQKLLYERGEISFDDWIDILLAAKKEVKVDFNTTNLELVSESSKIKKILDYEVLYVEVGDFIKKLYPYLKKREKENLTRLKTKNIQEYYRYVGKLLQNKQIRISRNYYQFSKYLKLLSLEEKLNYFLITEESSELYYEIKKNSQIGHSKELVYCQRYLDLMTRYSRNETTERESELWEAEELVFFDRLLKLSKQISLEDYLTSNRQTVEKIVSGMQKFYRYVNQRNAVMVRNLLEQMDAQNIADSVLIVGGYHSKKIKLILRAKGISYEEILVNTLANTESIVDIKKAYIERIKEQGIWAGLSPFNGTPQLLMKLTYLAVSILSDATLRMKVSNLIGEMLNNETINLKSLQKWEKSKYYSQLQDLLSSGNVAEQNKNDLINAIVGLFKVSSEVFGALPSIIGSAIENFEKLNLEVLKLSEEIMKKLLIKDNSLLKNKMVLIPKQSLDKKFIDKSGIKKGSLNLSSLQSTVANIRAELKTLKYYNKMDNVQKAKVEANVLDEVTLEAYLKREISKDLGHKIAKEESIYNYLDLFKMQGEKNKNNATMKVLNGRLVLYCGSNIVKSISANSNLDSIINKVEFLLCHEGTERHKIIELEMSPEAAHQAVLAEDFHRQSFYHAFPAFTDYVNSEAHFKEENMAWEAIHEYYIAEYYYKGIDAYQEDNYLEASNFFGEIIPNDKDLDIVFSQDNQHLGVLMKMFEVILAMRGNPYIIDNDIQMSADILNVVISELKNFFFNNIGNNVVDLIKIPLYQYLRDSFFKESFVIKMQYFFTMFKVEVFKYEDFTDQASQVKSIVFLYVVLSIILDFYKDDSDDRFSSQLTALNDHLGTINKWVYDLNRRVDADNTELQRVLGWCQKLQDSLVIKINLIYQSQTLVDPGVQQNNSKNQSSLVVHKYQGNSSNLVEIKSQDTGGSSDDIKVENEEYSLENGYNDLKSNLFGEIEEKKFDIVSTKSYQELMIISQANHGGLYLLTLLKMINTNYKKTPTTVLEWQEVVFYLILLDIFLKLPLNDIESINNKVSADIRSHNLFLDFNNPSSVFMIDNDDPYRVMFFALIGSSIISLQKEEKFRYFIQDFLNIIKKDESEGSKTKFVRLDRAGQNLYDALFLDIESDDFDSNSEPIYISLQNFLSQSKSFQDFLVGVWQRSVAEDFDDSEEDVTEWKRIFLGMILFPLLINAPAFELMNDNEVNYLEDWQARVQDYKALFNKFQITVKEMLKKAVQVDLNENKEGSTGKKPFQRYYGIYLQLLKKVNSLIFMEIQVEADEDSKAIASEQDSIFYIINKFTYSPNTNESKSSSIQEIKEASSRKNNNESLAMDNVSTLQEEIDKAYRLEPYIISCQLDSYIKNTINEQILLLNALKKSKLFLSNLTEISIDNFVESEFFVEEFYSNILFLLIFLKNMIDIPREERSFVFSEFVANLFKERLFDRIEAYLKGARYKLFQLGIPANNDTDFHYFYRHFSYLILVSQWFNKIHPLTSSKEVKAISNSYEGAFNSIVRANTLDYMRNLLRSHFTLSKVWARHENKYYQYYQGLLSQISYKMLLESNQIYLSQLSKLFYQQSNNMDSLLFCIMDPSNIEDAYIYVILKSLANTGSFSFLCNILHREKEVYPHYVSLEDRFQSTLFLLILIHVLQEYSLENPNIEFSYLKFMQDLKFFTDLLRKNLKKDQKHFNKSMLLAYSDAYAKLCLQWLNEVCNKLPNYDTAKTPNNLKKLKSNKQRKGNNKKSKGKFSKNKQSVVKGNNKKKKIKNKKGQGKKVNPKHPPKKQLNKSDKTKVIRTDMHKNSTKSKHSKKGKKQKIKSVGKSKQIPHKSGKSKVIRTDTNTHENSIKSKDFKKGKKQKNKGVGKSKQTLHKSKKSKVIGTDTNTHENSIKSKDFKKGKKQKIKSVGKSKQTPHKSEKIKVIGTDTNTHENSIKSKDFKKGKKQENKSVGKSKQTPHKSEKIKIIGTNTNTHKNLTKPKHYKKGKQREVKDVVNQKSSRGSMTKGTVFNSNKKSITPIGSILKTSIMNLNAQVNIELKVKLIKPSLRYNASNDLGRNQENLSSLNNKVDNVLNKPTKPPLKKPSLGNGVTQWENSLKLSNSLGDSFVNQSNPLLPNNKAVDSLGTTMGPFLYNNPDNFLAKPMKPPIPHKKIVDVSDNKEMTQDIIENKVKPNHEIVLIKPTVTQKEQKSDSQVTIWSGSNSSNSSNIQQSLSLDQAGSRIKKPSWFVSNTKKVNLAKKNFDCLLNSFIFINRMRQQYFDSDTTTTSNQYGNTLSIDNSKLLSFKNKEDSIIAYLYDNIFSADFLNIFVDFYKDKLPETKQNSFVLEVLEGIGIQKDDKEVITYYISRYIENMGKSRVIDEVYPLLFIIFSQYLFLGNGVSILWLTNEWTHLKKEKPTRNLSANLQCFFAICYLFQRMEKYDKERKFLQHFLGTLTRNLKSSIVEYLTGNYEYSRYIKILKSEFLMIIILDILRGDKKAQELDEDLTKLSAKVFLILRLIEKNNNLLPLYNPYFYHIVLPPLLFSSFLSKRWEQEYKKKEEAYKSIISPFTVILSNILANLNNRTQYHPLSRKDKQNIKQFIQKFNPNIILQGTETQVSIVSKIFSKKLFINFENNKKWLTNNWSDLSKNATPKKLNFFIDTYMFVQKIAVVDECQQFLVFILEELASSKQGNLSYSYGFAELSTSSLKDYQEYFLTLILISVFQRIPEDQRIAEVIKCLDDFFGYSLFTYQSLFCSIDNIKLYTAEKKIANYQQFSNFLLNKIYEVQKAKIAENKNNLIGDSSDVLENNSDLIDDSYDILEDNKSDMKYDNIDIEYINSDRSSDSNLWKTNSPEEKLAKLLQKDRRNNPKKVITITQDRGHYFFKHNESKKEAYKVGYCALYALARAILEDEGEDIDLTYSFDFMLIWEMLLTFSVVVNNAAFYEKPGTFIDAGSLEKFAKVLGYDLIIQERDVVSQAALQQVASTWRNDLENDFHRQMKKVTASSLGENPWGDANQQFQNFSTVANTHQVPGNTERDYKLYNQFKTSADQQSGPRNILGFSDDDSVLFYSEIVQKLKFLQFIPHIYIRQFGHLWSMENDSNNKKYFPIKRISHFSGAVMGVEYLVAKLPLKPAILTLKEMENDVPNNFVQIGYNQQTHNNKDQERLLELEEQYIQAHKVPFGNFEDNFNFQNIDFSIVVRDVMQDITEVNSDKGFNFQLNRLLDYESTEKESLDLERVMDIISYAKKNDNKEVLQKEAVFTLNMLILFGYFKIWGYQGQREDFKNNFISQFLTHEDRELSDGGNHEKALRSSGVLQKLVYESRAKINALINKIRSKDDEEESIGELKLLVEEILAIAAQAVQVEDGNTLSVEKEVGVFFSPDLFNYQKLELGYLGVEYPDLNNNNISRIRMERLENMIKDAIYVSDEFQNLPAKFLNLLISFQVEVGWQYLKLKVNNENQTDEQLLKTAQEEARVVFWEKKGSDLFELNRLRGYLSMLLDIEKGEKKVFTRFEVRAIKLGMIKLEKYLREERIKHGVNKEYTEANLFKYFPKIKAILAKHQKGSYRSILLPINNEIYNTIENKINNESMGTEIYLMGVLSMNDSLLTNVNIKYIPNKEFLKYIMSKEASLVDKKLFAAFRKSGQIVIARKDGKYLACDLAVGGSIQKELLGFNSNRMNIFDNTVFEQAEQVEHIAESINIIFDIILAQQIKSLTAKEDIQENNAMDKIENMYNTLIKNTVNSKNIKQVKYQDLINIYLATNSKINIFENVPNPNFIIRSIIHETAENGFTVCRKFENNKLISLEISMPGIPNYKLTPNFTFKIKQGVVAMKKGNHLLCGDILASLINMLPPFRLKRLEEELELRQEDLELIEKFARSA